MSARDVAARWGLPDWTDANAYPAPDKTTDREWRWEFLRRQPEYREAWDKWSAAGIDEKGEVRYARTSDPEAMRLRFGVNVIHDPCRSMTEDLLQRASVFFSTSGCLIWFSPDNDIRTGAHLARWEAETGKPGGVEREATRREAEAKASIDAGLVDYRFDLSRPLAPQITRARRQLFDWQEEFFGRKNTPRPRRDNWPLFLRALDARDCRATLAEMAAAFWPDLWQAEGNTSKTEQSARDTHEGAVRLRDNFPV